MPHLACGLVVVLWSIAGSGCAIQNLREANRRLKESNDRLVSENNRLEEELFSLRQGANEAEIVPASSPSVASLDPARIESSDLSGQLGLDPLLEIDNTPQGLRIRMPDKVFFALGQAKLTSRGERVLDQVANAIRRNYPEKMVRVEGHTDDTPIRKIRHLYPTNWELSTARACTVVRYLVERGGIDARQIYPAGFSYFRPVSSGKSASAKAQNRRVEILIHDDRGV